MEFLSSLGSIGIALLAFVVVFGPLVFFHELGHFWVARRFGVRIDAFSIGFGPALYSWRDKHDVEWRIGAFPLGGYVKFFGDANGASTPSDDVKALSEAERSDCFHFKPLYQRALIVAAGPIANFILAILIFAVVFMTAGQAYTSPEIGKVEKESGAEVGGVLTGDLVLSVDGISIESFEELRNYLATHPGSTLELLVERSGEEVMLTPTVGTVVRETLVGDRVMGLLGVGPAENKLIKVRRGPIEAFGYATLETRDTVVFIFNTVGELVTGQRSIKDLGGPAQIAHASGKVAQVSLVALVMFAALLSVNLGLINLFPIPMLDGGHLLYYAFEAVRGKPLGERAQEYGFRFGLALVLTLMVVVTWNDIIGFIS